MKRIARVSLIPLLGLASGAVQAEGWFWQSGARVFTEQNDNVLLSTTNAIDAATIGASARATVSLESETTRVALTPRVAFRQYSADQDLDNSSGELGVDLTQILERTAVGITGAFKRDTTLTSELEDSGNLRTKIDRNSVNVSPYVRYKMTPISGIKLGGTYRVVDYVDGEAQGYYDYDQVTAELAYEWDMTRRDLVSATAYVSDYTSDALFNDTRTSGLRFGWEHRFSEYTGTVLSAGAYNLDSEFQISGQRFEDSSTGSLFRAEINHKSPLTRYSLGFNSSLEPSSLGIVRRNNRLNATVNHAFSERLSGSLTALTLRVDSTDDQFTGDDRDYHAIDTGLAWQLDPLWRLRAGYRFVSQQYDNSSDSADSSRVSVAVEFNSLKHNF